MNPLYLPDDELVAAVNWLRRAAKLKEKPPIGVGIEKLLAWKRRDTEREIEKKPLHRVLDKLEEELDERGIRLEDE